MLSTKRVLEKMALYFSVSRKVRVGNGWCGIRWRNQSELSSVGIGNNISVGNASSCCQRSERMHIGTDVASCRLFVQRNGFSGQGTPPVKTHSVFASIFGPGGKTHGREPTTRKDL